MYTWTASYKGTALNLIFLWLHYPRHIRLSVKSPCSSCFVLGIYGDVFTKLLGEWYHPEKNGYDHLGTIRVSEFWPTNHWIGLRGNWNRKPQPISLVSGDDFPFNQSSDTTLRHSGISNRSGLRYRCPWPPDGVGREPWTLRVGLRRITPWLHSKKATYMII